MEGGAGESVVVVVPGLAERGQRQPEDVGRTVVGLKATCAEEMAHGVDAPGDMVDEEDPHQAAPEQAGEGTEQGAGDQEPGQRRYRKREQYEPGEVAADEAHSPVLVE